MGLSQDQIEGIRMAGIIHDIGKVSVPAEILSSPRRLTAIEFSLNSALEEIAQNKGVLYDPEAVDACLRLFRKKDYEIKI